MFPEKAKRKETGDSKTASSWTKHHLIALQMYFVPTDDVAVVVPSAFIPTPEREYF
jgi:hypothetical protein